MCQLQHFYNILRDAPWWDVKAKERQDKANHDRYKERQIKNTWTFPPKNIRAPIREFLGRPVRIWLDTLCVPVKGETKTMAITKLKRYYANADITVVLDAELLRVEHEKCSEGEILLRIALSGWMRRCWTYQEAIIASGRLRVLFADGDYDLPDVVGFMRQLNSIAPYLMSQKQQQRSQDVMEAMTYSATAIGTAFDIYRKSLWIIDPSKALNNALNGSSTINLGPYINRAKGIFNPKDPFKFLPAPERLAADTKSFFAGITAMWAEQPTAVEEHLQNRVHRMVAAWESLRYRTTSHARDRLVNFVFACAKEQRDFAALQKVLDEPAERRFRTWLLDQPALPAGLLFVQGPKMGERGFRWAPADVHVASVEDDAPAEKSYRVVLDWASAPPDVTAECLADVGPSLALVLRREPENGSIETAALLKDVAGAETVCTGSFVCRALVKRGKRPSSDAVTAEVTGLRAADDQHWIVS